MRNTKVSFKNKEGYELRANLEVPADGHPHSYVIFAHCFTCSRNYTATRIISRALTHDGFAVLRFDFTGLGDSEGDFADTNFTSNVEDLVSAAAWLTEHHRAPIMLIGHSLGGAAVIHAAHKISSIKAVVTLNAPSRPDHVKHLLRDDIGTISRLGKARVNISGREFHIRSSFLKDLDNRNTAKKIAELNCALLILHSPQDAIVNIVNAEEIYRSAVHPKSYVSLDGADHLLSNKKDAQYVGRLIAGWVSRYIYIPEETPLFSDEQVVVRNDTSSFTTDVRAGVHALTADEPIKDGGNNFGPTPYDLLLAGLGACTAMTLRMYSQRKKWPLDEVRVHLTHGRRYAEDCVDCDEKDAKIEHIDRLIEIEGDLDSAQIKRLLEIADRCPVHRTLTEGLSVGTKHINNGQ